MKFLSVEQEKDGYFTVAYSDDNTESSRFVARERKLCWDEVFCAMNRMWALGKKYPTGKPKPKTLNVPETMSPDEIPYGGIPE